MTKDFINLVIVIVVFLVVRKRCQLKLSDNLLIFFHLLVLLLINQYLPKSYLPDQLSYLYAANEWRNLSWCTHPFITVCSTSFLFALFPLFINSVLSLALINFIFYLLFLMIVIKIYDNHPFSNYARLFVLLYPSLIFNSSVGLRDILIVLFMFASGISYIYANKRIWGIFYLLPLILLKPQNVGILLVSYAFYEYLRISNKKWKVFYFVLSGLLVVLISVHYYPALHVARNRMYAESYHLNPYIFELTFPDWSISELYRFFLAPLPWDAKNLQQQIQGYETLGLSALLLYLWCRLRKYQICKKKFLTLVFMLITASILYSYAVFNVGAIVRYRFPFYLCFFLLLPLCIDEDKVQNLPPDMC